MERRTSERRPVGTQREDAGLTRADLLALPAVVPLWPTACKAFGVGRTKGHEMARAGEFPVPVRRLGRRLVVITADLWRYLGIEPVADDRASA